MPTWDPRQYLKFSDHRLRPALDLFAQVQAERPQVVYDLGCGPGNITRLLSERWPAARIVGVDSSREMLDRARTQAPGVEFLQADILHWSPPAPADVLFSNATLHWLDDHARLLSRLMSHLAPGGVLAVQMPCNRDAPSHLLMEAAAADGPWRAQLSQVRPVLGSVESADAYYRILAPLAGRIDIWETEYLHVLEGDNPVVEWTSGTALRPCLDALEQPARDAFLAAYARRIALAYPRAADGRTLFPFRRIFIVAQR